jgi:hypothetical protein
VNAEGGGGGWGLRPEVASKYAVFHGSYISFWTHALQFFCLVFGME